MYRGYDLVSARPIYVYFTPSFPPLFAGIPDEERAGRLVEAMENNGFGLLDENITPIPSYDSPVQYWRGQVWININWLLMHGQEDYNCEEHAERLRQAIDSLCQKRKFQRILRPV